MWGLVSVTEQESYCYKLEVNIGDKPILLIFKYREGSSINGYKVGY